MNGVSADTRPATISSQAVRFGSPELRQLIEEIGRSSAASKREGRSLHPAIDLARQSRLGALRVPSAEGGGSSVREFFAVLIDLAEADADVAHILRALFWFVEERLRSTNATERARWLSRVVQGDIFGNAVTELGGSAAVGSFVLQTQLTPKGNGHVLCGKKYYCTGSLYSDWVSVMASTPEGALASAVIPINRAGMILEDDWDGIGQRLTGSGTGIFSDVAVQADEVLIAAVESTEVASLQSPTDPLSRRAVLPADPHGHHRRRVEKRCDGCGAAGAQACPTLHARQCRDRRCRSPAATGHWSDCEQRVCG